MPQTAPTVQTHDIGAPAPIPSFTCHFSIDGEGTAHVRPAGELDIATSPQLGQMLWSAMAGARLVVLDLSELQFLDSSGVHVIAAAASAARALGRRVITIGGSDHAHDIFALTGSEDDVNLQRLPPEPVVV